MSGQKQRDESMNAIRVILIIILLSPVVVFVNQLLRQDSPERMATIAQQDISGSTGTTIFFLAMIGLFVCIAGLLIGGIMTVQKGRIRRERIMRDANRVKQSDPPIIGLALRVLGWLMANSGFPALGMSVALFYIGQLSSYNNC